MVGRQVWVKCMRIDLIKFNAISRTMHYSLHRAERLCPVKFLKLSDGGGAVRPSSMLIDFTHPCLPVIYALGLSVWVLQPSSGRRSWKLCYDVPIFCVVRVFAEFLRHFVWEDIHPMPFVLITLRYIVQVVTVLSSGVFARRDRPLHQPPSA